MDRVELADLADRLLDAHRSTLLIDPFFKISIEVVEGESYAECVKDESSPLAWIIKLDPEKHLDAYDIQYSVVESLIGIVMNPLEGEEKGGIIARLTTSICNCFSDDEEEDDEEEEYELDDDY